LIIIFGPSVHIIPIFCHCHWCKSPAYLRCLRTWSNCNVAWSNYRSWNSRWKTGPRKRRSKRISCKRWAQTSTGLSG